MATYSLNSIDEAAFTKFCEKPSASQIEILLGALSAGDFDGIPKDESLVPWIREHLAAKDWYEGLSEDAMQAWDNGIRALLDQPEFDLKAHGYHCAVSDMFIQMADRVYTERGEDAVVRKFWPYRFFDTYGLDQTGYFPTWALLTNKQVGKLIKEVQDYDGLLAEYAKKKPDFVERWREQINEDVKEATPALQEIYDQKRMWYAQLDY